MEACDPEMLDENCDGAKNEGCTCTAGETQVCGKDKGVCKPGTQTCVDGTWSPECQGAVDPQTPEACDAAREDEDCDGEKNEGCDCIDGTEEACPGMAVGICKPGRHSCEKGKWGRCTDVVTAEQEVCDGIDNDCNGVPDNSPRDCASNEQCRNGKCVCVPRRGCDVLECGLDECGTSCGTCRATPTDGDASGGKCYTGSCSSSGTCESTKPIQCLVDSDKDGYPAANSTRQICAGSCPDGFVDPIQSKQTDCDDRDPRSFPGNPNWYHDKIDHDCSGHFEGEQHTVNTGCAAACGADGNCAQASRPFIESDCGKTTEVCETTISCVNGCTKLRMPGYPIRCH